jgi:hypothetical protein
MGSMTGLWWSNHAREVWSLLGLARIDLHTRTGYAIARVFRRISEVTTSSYPARCDVLWFGLASDRAGMYSLYSSFYVRNVTHWVLFLPIQVMYIRFRRLSPGPCLDR